MCVMQTRREAFFGQSLHFLQWVISRESAQAGAHQIRTGSGSASESCIVQELIHPPL